MTAGNDELERIVCEVLRRLRGSESAAATPATVPMAAVPGKGSPAANSPVPEILQRVITLAALEGRLNGSPCIRVPCGAIITPAVHDELRRRGIRIQYVPVPSPDASGRWSPEVLLAAWHTTFSPSALVQAIRADGHPLTVLDPTDGLHAMVRSIAAAGGQTCRVGLLLTDRPSLSLCLASRPPRVRPAWGLDRRSVAEAMDSLAANLLILEPARHGLPSLIDTTRAFLRGGGGSYPAQLQQAIPLD